MKAKKHGISAWVYIITFACLAAGFVTLFLYCAGQSRVVRSYVFAGEAVSTPQDGLMLSVNIQADKEWKDDEHHPDLPYGAQYDGVLQNRSDYTFRDWQAVITFSDGFYIDSSWNGTFDSKDNTLTFTPEGDPLVVKPHADATFGAIMYAKENMTMKSAVLTGRRIVTPWQLPAAWILGALALIWLFALIVHLILAARMRRYILRQELDSEIIQQSMNTFIGFIDAKDSYTRGHSSRVAAYAREIAARMKMPEEQIQQLYYLTLMHDCGKIGIPDAILKKPGRLTPEEYRIIQSHTTLGDSILINFTAIPGIRDGAHYHHERYDGHGYPDGLSGKDIPLCARIICVADSYDAMSTNRCYRNKLSRDRILQELHDCSGKQFDPEIVDIFMTMISDGFTDKVMAAIPSFDGEN